MRAAIFYIFFHGHGSDEYFNKVPPPHTFDGFALAPPPSEILTVHAYIDIYILFR